MQAWAQSGDPLRLVEREPDSDDELKALACYGVYLPMNSTEEDPTDDSAEGSFAEDSAEENAERDREADMEPDMLIRFVEDRPVSGVTTTFLKWVCERLDQRDTDVWALIWDQASWHVSHEVQNWIQEYNERVKEEGGVRILACQLPSKSPWLNPIEPKWLHGKRAICEPDGTLSPEDIVERVHAYYECRRSELIPKETD